MDNCPVCFKEQKGYKLLKGDLAFACLQYEIERLQSARANPSPVEEGETERLEQEVQHLLEEAARMSSELDKAERLRQKLRLKVKDLEGEVERLRREGMRRAPGEGSPTLDLALIRKMLLLCHPDKHQGSEQATEVTRWILAQKAKIDR